MKKPMIREHNAETNEIVDREMTDEEFAFFEAANAEAQTQIANEAKKASEKAALLNRLGITEDEARLLLS